MSQDGDREEHTVPPAVGRYANYFKVGCNAFEVVLEFGERFSDEAARLHTRIVTNPLYARALLATLDDSLRKQAESWPTDLADAIAPPREDRP